MTYFPLDRELLTSSMWAEGSPEGIKVWIYLLLSADPRTGIARDTDPAIALRCGLTIEATTKVLDWLAAPDRHSRTKALDGRRIERLPEGGLRIVSYAAYQRRDYSTPRVHRWRERRASETAKRVSKRPETTNKNKNTDMNKDIQTTDSGRCASGDAPSPVPSWSCEAADDWQQRFQGTAPGGRIGRALKPLVATHGWPAVRAAWRAYLAEAEAEYASPARFAVTYGRWTGTAARPTARGKPSVGERTVDNLNAWIDSKEAAR